MADRPRSLLTHFTDGALLLLALQSSVWGLVTACAVEVETARLALCLCLLALGSLLLTLLPDRGRRVTALAVLALWGVRLWRSWERLGWGTTALWCDIVNTWARKLPHIQALEPALTLTEEQWAALVTDWLIMAALPMALALGWLLCRRRQSLGVILLTLLPLLPAILVTEAPAAWVLAALLGLWGVLALGELTDAADPAGTARSRLPGAVAMALALAILFRSLPTTGTAQPRWAADLREGAINNAGRLSLSDLWSRQDWHIFAGAGSSRQVDLLTRPVFTGRVALRVNTNAPGTRLLRGWSAETFTGTGWAPLGGEAREELEAIRSQGLEPLLQLGESILAVEEHINWGGRSARGTMTVEDVSAPGSCVYYPYGLYTVPEGAALEDGAHLSRTQGWSHTLDFCPDYNWIYLDGNSAYWNSLLEPDPAEEAYRNFVYDRDLEVDEESRRVLLDWWGRNCATYASLDEYILGGYRGGEWVWSRPATGEDLARLEQDPSLSWLWPFVDDEYLGWYQYMWEAGLGFGELPDGTEQIREGQVYVWEKDRRPVTDEERGWYRDTYISRVTDRLRTALELTTTYDLNAPICPEGENYLNYFLNDSRRGWCMHYATTTALMLRCLGIPARYVSGYVAQPTVQHPEVEVHDYDAHAWVEYYLDGIGWLPLDLTPQAGYGADSLQAGETARPTQTASQENATPTPTPTETPTAAPTAGAAPSAAPTQAPQQGETAGEEQEESRGLSLAWLWPALVPVLGWGAWTLARRRRAGQLTQPDTNAAVLRAYALGEGLKSWGGGGGEELAALAKKARFSQHTLTEEERRRALELLAGEIEGLARTLPGWKRPVFQVLWGDLVPILKGGSDDVS